MTKHKPLATLALATFAAACGSERSSEPNSGARIYTSSLSNVTEVAQRASVTCTASAAQCQKGVGQLYAEVERTSTSVSYSMCTAFIIAPDLAVTNSHCLPTQHTAGSTCAGDIAIKLASGPGVAGEVVGCHSVVSRSPWQSRSEVDYAVLRLARPVTSRTNFALDHGPLRDRAALSIYSVTPTDGEEGGGTLEVRPFRINRHTPGITGRAPGPHQYLSEYVEGPAVAHGNSGSPVVNDNGAAVGVLSHGLFGANSSLGVSGRMTSLGCVSFDHAPRRLPRTCF